MRTVQLIGPYFTRLGDAAPGELVTLSAAPAVQVPVQIHQFARIACGRVENEQQSKGALRTPTPDALSSRSGVWDQFECGHRS